MKNIKENYIQLAVRTENPPKKLIQRIADGSEIYRPIIRILHSGLGIVTEIDELLEAVSPEHIREEIGDIYWFTAIGCDVLAIEFHVPEYSSSEYPSKRTVMETISAIQHHVSLILDATKARMFYDRKEKDGNTYEEICKEAYKKILHQCLPTLTAASGLNVEQIMKGNLAKLQVRKPELFGDHPEIRDYQKEYEAAAQAI